MITFRRGVGRDSRRRHIAALEPAGWTRGRLSPSTASTPVISTVYSAATTRSHRKCGSASSTRVGATSVVTHSTSAFTITTNRPMVDSSSRPVNATITGRTNRFASTRIAPAISQPIRPAPLNRTIGTWSGPNGNGWATWISPRRKRTTATTAAPTTVSTMNRRMVVRLLRGGCLPRRRLRRSRLAGGRLASCRLAGRRLAGRRGGSRAVGGLGCGPVAGDRERLRDRCLQLPGVVVERRAGLRLLDAAQVDAPLGEVGARLGRDLERLGRGALRRQLEDPRAVGVQPHLGDDLALARRRRPQLGDELALEQERGAKRQQRIELDAIGGVRAEERTLALGEQAPDRGRPTNGAADVAAARAALERGRAHEPAGERVHLDVEALVTPELGRQGRRVDRS